MQIYDQEESLDCKRGNLDFLFALVPIMGWRTHDKFVFQGVCYFPFIKIYTTLSSVINFILPLLITCGIYIKIYLIASSQQNIFYGDASRIPKLRSTEEKKVYSRNIRAAKTISIFVVVFFSCWIPFSFISVVSNLCGSQCEIPHEVVVLFLMFGYLNSALNPFLLAFRTSKFKATMSALMQLLRSRAVAKGPNGRSTLTQSTCHSEHPDLQDRQICLQFVNAKRDSLSRNTQSTL